jgi:hypothetical protein
VEGFPKPPLSLLLKVPLPLLKEVDSAASEARRCGGTYPPPMLSAALFLVFAAFLLSHAVDVKSRNDQTTGKPHFPSL